MRRIGLFPVLLSGLLQSAGAAELLNGNGVVELEKGAAVASSSTFAGYPIYGGDGKWEFFTASNSVSGALGEAQPVNIARLTLRHFEPDGTWFAVMQLRVNTSFVGGNQYTTGSPCKGEFTYVVDKSVALTDNCQTLKAESYKSGDRDKVYLSLRFTHTASAGRRLIMEMMLNPDLLGFRQTDIGFWSAESVAQSLVKQRFIERVKQWGTQLQDANQVAIGFNKPKDAYANVPSFRNLLDVPEDLSDGTFTQDFIGAVENVKHAPDFKAIAYSKWGEGRISWVSYDNEESESVAAAKALNRCNQNKHANSGPCVLYDLKGK